MNHVRDEATDRSGPLSRLRVIELGGIGPVPFCGRILSDLGADVIRLDRLTSSWSADLDGDPYDVNARGRRSVAIDLKHPKAAGLVVGLCDRADILVEGFRPGVMERLGVGPDVCLERNPRLVYARCSGWGRTGPLASAAGHDLSYVALSGALSLFGAPDQPPPALLGYVGDHGGGGMSLVIGILAAIVEANASGRGQVVETSILDGATMLTSADHDMLAQGARTAGRWSHLADGSAPFYNTYATSDGRYVAVSAVEPQFYSCLLRLLELEEEITWGQADRGHWAATKELFAARFRTRTRDEWSQLAGDSDACLAPILDLDEVPRHPHHVEQKSFVEVDGYPQPAPRPQFDRTPAGDPSGRPRRGQHTRSALAAWGMPEADVDELIDGRVLFPM